MPTGKYDLALSFAASNRELARSLRNRLVELGYAVFIDEDVEHELWGANAKDHFARVFGRDAAYCLVLISKDYDERAWTMFEREVMEARQLHDRSNFLLPVTTDGHRPDWLLGTRIYFDLTQRSVADLLSLIARKIAPGAFDDETPNTDGPVPRLAWASRVGIATWKNGPLPLSDRIIFPTAGAEWNKPDADDGLYCLDRATGSRLWMAPTHSDCNSALVDGDRIYVGTDSGRVHCFDVSDGGEVWQSGPGAPVLSRPVRTGQGILITTSGGDIRVIDPASGKSVGYSQVQGGVVADPVVAGDTVYLATTAGWVYELPFDKQVSRAAPLGRHALLNYPSKFELTGQAPCAFHGNPTVWGNLLALPFVRYTYFPGVPITVVDRRTLQQLWPVASHEDPKRQFGNIRCAPIVAGNVLIVAVAYGNEVVGLDRSGGVVWTCTAGRPFFPQWGSPALHRSTSVVPRYDGFVHAVNCSTGAREWSLFFGRRDDAGKYFGPQESLPGALVYPQWHNDEAYPLNAPAAVIEDEVYISSSEGFAFRVDLVGGGGPRSG